MFAQEPLSLQTVQLRASRFLEIVKASKDGGVEQTKGDRQLLAAARHWQSVPKQRPVCLEGIIAFSKNEEEESKLEMWPVQDGSKVLERSQALPIDH
jgi:hypothetical protein